uniref:CoA carboxyltransferase C-terminal domain-containing protein n=1 Tax=Pyrodinium bahamense TaxID=73915 RepID=A0A7S0FDB6_9DINO
MYGEILKYGAQIVDALVEYEHPIFVYIPPNGELRGGAWVVIDPKINPDKMEMYADVESRGGILEPPGIVEVKYRAPQQVQAMHRHDPRLAELNTQLRDATGTQNEELEQAVKARERQLLPLYTSIAVHFADLHDRASRMQAVGVIRRSIEWKDARRFFFWRVKRRVLQDHFIRQLRQADPRLSQGDAASCVERWAKEGRVDVASDEQTARWLEAQDFDVRAEALRTSYIKGQLEALLGELPERERCEVLRGAAAAGGPKKCEACAVM